MSKYLYDKKAFDKTITGTGVFCLLVGLYSVWMMLSGNMLFWIVLLVCVYQVYNTFFSLSNPSEVDITESSISFSAYGKTNTYPLDEITTFRVKEINPPKKLYLRIGTPSSREGRYWINCGNMNDSKELWERLAYLEYCKEPGQIKFRAHIPVNPAEKEKTL